MKWKAGIIGVALACLGSHAFGYLSSYTAISLPGNSFLTWWDVNANVLTNTADYVWSGTVTFPSNSGAFKFAANHAWDTAWGGSLSLFHMPARNVGPASLSGGDMSYNNIPTGQYTVTFYEQTATFDFVPLAAAPNPSAVQLIGSFNGDGSTSLGTMTNTSGTVWETSVDLNPGADFLFKVTSVSGSVNRGALVPSEISTLPYSGGNPCASARYTLNVSTGGTFQFSYNLLSNTFGIVRTHTNSFALSSVTAIGNFVAGKPPDINLEKIDSSIWRPDFFVTNASQFTLSFLGRDSFGDVGRYWGLSSSTTSSLPATGYMLPSSNNIYTNIILTATPGSYRITFDSNSGAYAIQQRYTAVSGFNYFLNPSFESVSGGIPSDWSTYHATSGEQASFGAHSGARCGVLMAKINPDDPDLGNFDQTTSVLKGLSGQTFRVSASFRTKGTWTSETVRIIVEWKIGNTLVSEKSTEIVGLTNQWRTFSFETLVPATSVTAKILFKYDGNPGTGFLLIDDAEARITASRFQDFNGNGWTNATSFQHINPDWEATSGKTILNSSATTPTGGVLISKYIEGSDNNKAIEIFNGYASPTNLATAQYVLQQYNNGATSPSVNIALSGTLGAGQCLVVSRLSTPTNAYPPDPTILSAGQLHLQTNALTFNGDDVVVLRKGGVNGPIVDRIGQVSTNVAGSLWSRLATDHSFQRYSTIFWGSTNAPTNVFSFTEWNVLPKDNLSELGSHFFSSTDTNAPYLPTGYSLLLNTNASLVTPELEGGIGDISFYARSQGTPTGSDMQLVVETSTSQISTNWTTLETLTIPLSTTNFTLFSSYAARSDHSVLRLRHVAAVGSTNRIRIDDVRVSEAYKIKRSENFAAWTNYLGSPIGTYSIAEWTIQNARIGTNGPYGNVCADVYPSAGSVISPTYESGVGTVKFWLSQHPQDRGEIRATVYTSTNQGTSWTSNTTVGLPAPTGTNVLKTNFTVAIYLPTSSCLRIAADISPSPFVIDNIEIAIPFLSRILTFDDFSISSGYGAYSKDGWSLTDTMIVTNFVYAGQSARIRNGTIVSPYMDTIGAISFYYMQFSSDSTARLKVEISPDASSWNVLTTNLLASTSAQFYSYLNTNTTYHYVRITQTTKDKRIHIDQIEIGEPAAIPSCTISAALSPSAPSVNENFYLTAEVVARNGADVLSVTGAYAYATNGPWTSLAMTTTDPGSYRSGLLSGLPAGTQLFFKASVRYAGIGAAPGSTSYTTNTAFSSTNSIIISSVPRGSVWINEIFYSAHEGEYDFFEDIFFEDHEFVELCGIAGTSIAGWKIQFLFCSASNILQNGQALYASYTIPAGTVLSNSASGYGFYVLGDSALQSSNYPVNQVLSTLLPTNIVRDNPGARDHIHDPSGIITLLDNYSNVVYSLSYGAYNSGAQKIPVSQAPFDNTNSLSLSGTGAVYAAFAWNDDGKLTIGAANTGQVFQDVDVPPMGAWHTPASMANTALQGSFFHFHPMNAAQSDTLYVHYAYTNATFNYADIDGRVHHHKQGGIGTWNMATKQVDFPGNYDTNGFAYLRTTITNYTYERLDTIEYVIEAVPNKSGYATTFLGSDGSGSSIPYTNLVEAQQHPFEYTFPIADPIVITYFSLSNTTVHIETDGNDTLDPIVNFRVRSTTNLLIPTYSWVTNAVQSMTRTNEQNYFTLTNPPGTRRFFAIQLLWP